jgi:hypothetical protein
VFGVRKKKCKDSISPSLDEGEKAQRRAIEPKNSKPKHRGVGFLAQREFGVSFLLTIWIKEKYKIKKREEEETSKCWNREIIDRDSTPKRARTPQTDHAEVIGKQPSLIHVIDHLGEKDTNSQVIHRLQTIHQHERT